MLLRWDITGWQLFGLKGRVKEFQILDECAKVVFSAIFDQSGRLTNFYRDDEKYDFCYTIGLDKGASLKRKGREMIEYHNYRPVLRERYSYTYFSCGHPFLSEWIDPFSPQYNQYTEYEYDRVGRLVKATTFSHDKSEPYLYSPKAEFHSDYIDQVDKYAYEGPHLVWHSLESVLGSSTFRYEYEFDVMGNWNSAIEVCDNKSTKRYSRVITYF